MLEADVIGCFARFFGRLGRLWGRRLAAGGEPPVPGE